METEPSGAESIITIMAMPISNLSGSAEASVVLTFWHKRRIRTLAANPLFHFFLVIVRAGQAYPRDSINELII